MTDFRKCICTADDWRECSAHRDDGRELFAQCEYVHWDGKDNICLCREDFE